MTLTLSHDQLLWRVGQHLLMQRPHRLRESVSFHVRRKHGGHQVADPWQLEVWGNVDPSDTFMVSGEEFILPFGTGYLSELVAGICIEGFSLLGGCPLLGVHVRVEGCSIDPPLEDGEDHPGDMLFAMRDAGRRILRHAARRRRQVDRATGVVGVHMNMGKQSPRTLAGILKVTSSPAPESSP